jgi:hypothetical protein
MLKKSQSFSPIWENVFLGIINATKFYEILTKSIHIYSLFKLVIFLLENLLPNGEISTVGPAKHRVIGAFQTIPKINLKLNTLQTCQQIEKINSRYS